MNTMEFPDWQAMAQPTEQGDRQTLTEARAARAAVIQAFHFMSAHFGAVGPDGNPQATNPPEALQHIRQLAGAYQTLGAMVFRMSGKDV
jgi:hypothetical protein